MDSLVIHEPSIHVPSPHLEMQKDFQQIHKRALSKGIVKTKEAADYMLHQQDRKERHEGRNRLIDREACKSNRRDYSIRGRENMFDLLGEVTSQHPWNRGGKRFDRKLSDFGGKTHVFSKVTAQNDQKYPTLRREQSPKVPDEQRTKSTAVQNEAVFGNRRHSGESAASAQHCRPK